MAVLRLSWPSVSNGSRVAPCALIAGLPFALLPRGVALTSVAWADDPDPAWHLSGTIASKNWLDLGPDAPELVFEERASPVQGTLEVKDVTLHLLDVDGEVVRCFHSPATPFALLGADVSASATSIAVDAIGLFDTSGVVHIGRERLTYTGKSGSSLTGCTRGTAGTKAQPYTAAARHRVYAQPAGVDLLLSTVGRRVTVWMLALDASGTATDPTLMYDGRGYIGGGLTDDGAAWELATRHVLKELAEKSTTPVVSLYGYAHPNNATLRQATVVGGAGSAGRTPLAGWWMPESTGGTCVLLEGTDANGWHPTREMFLTDWNSAAATLSTSLRAAVASDGRCLLVANDGTGRRLTGLFGWERTRVMSDPDDPENTAENARVTSASPMPPACLWLAGTVTLAPTDLAQIPAVPSNPLTDNIYVYWTLAAKRDNGVLPAADIAVRIQTVGVNAITVAEGEAYLTHGDAGVLLTRPTPARLGISASGPRWWTVLQHGVFGQIDQVRGIDWLSDSIDWAQIATIASLNPGLGNPARELVVDLTAPLLDLLTNEARLMGAALVTHQGRVAFGLFRTLAPTTPRVANLSTDDLRADERAAAEQSPDGLLTAFSVTLADTGDVIRVVDQGAVKESGEGDELKATAPRGCLPQGVETPALFRAVTDLAMGVIAPFARPYQVITVPVTLAFAHVEIGDVVGLDEWMLPTSLGARGLDTQGVVIGRSVNVTTGAVDLRIMVSIYPVYGYAPEAIVTSISGAVLTLNTVLFGAAGFADAYMDDGVTPRTDGGASTFSAGDKIQLLELDTETPATPFNGEVLSTSGATVTLTASPGATWETRASSGLVMLVFARWDIAVAAQKTWAFVADDSAGALSDGTPARRYA